jgi:hypothetical protein
VLRVKKDKPLKANQLFDRRCVFEGMELLLSDAL